MAKKHDERKCLCSLSKVLRIEDNHLVANVDANIGIHRWGMIDYLTKYCGYYFHYTTKGVSPKSITFSDDNADESVKAAKKVRKERKFNNNNKKK